MTIPEALARHGHTAKAVRAWCAERKLRHTPQGAPAEWYAAWRAQAIPSDDASAREDP